MKREFIVAKIEGSQDGSPYVYVTFNDPKEYKPDKPNMNPFGSNVASFTSIEDLMKNMPKVMASFPGLGGGLTDSPTIKFSMHEYQLPSLAATTGSRPGRSVAIRADAACECPKLPSRGRQHRGAFAAR